MRKVMIVDDEYLVRVGLKSFMDWEKHGYTIVAEASDGEEAMEKIQRLQPDVVLTDLKMDGMDGFQLIAQCRKQFPRIKFIVLSNFDDGENVKKAMKLGASDYTFKLTARPQDLLQILSELDFEEPATAMGQIMRRNLPAIKSHLIQQAAQKHIPAPQELKRDFQKMGLNTDFSKPYCAMLFRYRAGSGPVEDSPMMRYAMENMIGEVLSEHFQAETYGFAGDQMISVLSAQGMDFETVTRYGKTAFTRIHEYVPRYLGLQIEAALSPIRNGLEQFSGAVSLCRKMLDTRHGDSTGELAVFSGEARPEIQRVCQYALEHLNEDFTVGQAARMCSMSESYFSHLFKREMGVTFVDYLNQQRVRRAEKLLEQTELRIGEIAAAVGVENPNYFSVLFKKVRGESPQEYRTRIKGGRKAES